MQTPPAPPELPVDAHKGDAGRVLAFVGARTMPGAAILVARAAQRAGAGLVTLAVPDRGVIAAGLRADFVLWNVKNPAQLSYAIGYNPHVQTVFKGQPR